MVEFYYWRESSGGKSRLETVVLFLPDVWSAQCSRVEWPDVLERYKAACEASLQRLGEPAPPAPPAAPAAAPAQPQDQADSQPDSSLIVCSQFCLVKFPAARRARRRSFAGSACEETAVLLR